MYKNVNILFCNDFPSEEVGIEDTSVSGRLERANRNVGETFHFREDH